ncbi:hypothetical protein [Streptomyces chartreusis]|uniref:hypothetical protein n=1 Tax=Streptomyces chartreusis TaxID=1969 RepID=UPI00382003A8
MSTSTPAAQDQRDENAAYLPELTRECEQRGLALQTVGATPDGLAKIQVIVGRRTLVVPPTADLAETLDDFRLIGKCLACRNELDDTATPYHPGYNHIEGSPLMVCQPCRDQQAKIANDPNRLAFSKCMNAVEAVFQASENPAMTRKALREFVDMEASKAGAATAGGLTAEQSAFAADIPLGGWMTAPVESALRDIDDSYTAAENEHMPFLAAKAVITDYRSQAYGRRTEVWLDYGRTTGTLTPAKARDVLAAMAGFCAQFEAVIELAEHEAASDFEGDPEIAAADREAEDRSIRATTEARRAAA